MDGIKPRARALQGDIDEVADTHVPQVVSLLLGETGEGQLPHGDARVLLITSCGALGLLVGHGEHAMCAVHHVETPLVYEGMSGSGQADDYRYSCTDKGTLGANDEGARQ